MNESHSLESESAPSLTRRIGPLAYGALFVIVLPLLLGWWAVALDRRVSLPPIGSPVVGWAFAGIGLLVIIAAIVVLRVRGGGWPMSPYPPRTFVTTGVYSLLSHPLYAGATVLAAGVFMIDQSPAGMWIVMPVLAAAAIAFVWGSEAERTNALFGNPTTRPLLHLPDSTNAVPSLSDRISVYLLALLPWFVAYEAVNLLETPPDALSVTSALDARLPVIGWTELLYLLAYPIVLLAPLVARSRRDLRELTIRAWVATAGSAICYLAFPTFFAEKPVPPTIFAPLLEWERAWHAPNTALPAFHVIWVILTFDVYVGALPRWRVVHVLLVIATAVSCVTTGMHAIADVLAGLLFGVAFLRIGVVWRRVLRWAEALSASRAEWRFGPLRLINHGIYAALAVLAGFFIVTRIAGPQSVAGTAITTAACIAGAAFWAQWLEGGNALSRPFGYFGALAGGTLALGLLSLTTGDGWLLFAAFTVASPFIQGIGRLRCLVQGCCHGRPTVTAMGIRVTEPSSRVVSLSGLSGTALHPTAVYSMVTNGIVGILMLRMAAAGAPLTFLAGSYFILTGLGRFVEEHYRGEPQTRVIAGLRLYQWLSMASVLIGAVLTTLPSPPTPPAQDLTSSAILTAVVCSLAAYAAYGVDFPRSTRRFARLS